MSTTNFVNTTTLSDASWFNDVDALTYENASSFSSIVTAAGTTTLTLNSAFVLEFTGTTTQTVVMPVCTTLTPSWKRNIINNSTGALTINSSGGNLIQTLSAGARATLTCVLASGTTAASWASTSNRIWTAYTPTISADVGTWGAPTVTTARYRLLDEKTLLLVLDITATVASGSPTEMRVLLPEGRSGAAYTGPMIPYRAVNNGVAEFGIYRQLQDTFISFQRTSGAFVGICAIGAQLTMELL